MYVVTMRDVISPGRNSKMSSSILPHFGRTANRDEWVLHLKTHHARNTACQGILSDGRGYNPWRRVGSVAAASRAGLTAREPGRPARHRSPPLQGPRGGHRRTTARSENGSKCHQVLRDCSVICYGKQRRLKTHPHEEAGLRASDATVPQTGKYLRRKPVAVVITGILRHERITSKCVSPVLKFPPLMSRVD